mmetsp:Transcript_27429/g.58946  ORF Transcript_27429/g.58946 Transcript_27429/m.58946 type:complete len:731 (+) Transcript_27429:224-2416(+)
MRRPIIRELLSPTFSADEDVSLDFYADDTEVEDAAGAIKALIIILILVTLTILFEKMKHAAEHHAGRALRPIVACLFGELTVLGFLSMVTYCLDKGGAFLALGRMISRHMYDGEEEEGEVKEEEEIFELVESIHFAMFFVMVIFLVSVLIEVHQGLQSHQTWCQWDRACHCKAYVENLLREHAELDEKHDEVSSMPGLRGIYKRMLRFLLPYLSFLPFLRDATRECLEDKMEFCALRLEFLKERTNTPPFAPAGEVGGNQKTIGDHFNFGRYLTFVYAKKMAHVVETNVNTWLLFAGATVCYFLLFDALEFSLKGLAWAWVLVGWVFHVLSINFEKYLLGIRDRFLATEYVPKPKFRRLTWHAAVNSQGNLVSYDGGTEKEPLRKLGRGLPMWCYIDFDQLDRQRSKLAKMIFGPTPRHRQHALYLFGSDGPEFHLSCLRIMLVFSCIYSAQLIILFVPMMAQDENTSAFSLIVYCVLASIPALAFIFNKKRLIATLIQVGTIGPFVLPQSISDSEREEQTSMTVRVLMLYFKLASMTKQFLADPSTFELARARSHYTNSLSSEEIAELGRMFRLFFDPDGDGSLTGKEFQSLMNTAGIMLADSEADQLIRAMVKSAESLIEVKDTEDGKMALSTHGFFQWYSDQLGDNDDKKECAQFLFSLFDDDNSGDITVMEFKQQLDKMAIGISQEEANELLQELDLDGNGVLSETEFEELIEHFYPVEFQNRSKD